jgi:hypothetical protein
VVDKVKVWERIQHYAGEEFRTKTELPFTYVVPGNFLRVTRQGHEINRSLVANELREGDGRDAGRRPGRPD